MKKTLYTIILSFTLMMAMDLHAQSQTDLDKGMRYVEENGETWGLQESDYAQTMVSDMYTNTKTGLTYIYLIQAYEGVPVQNAITPLVIDKMGTVRMVQHGYIANLKEKINGTKAMLTPLAAIKSAVSHLGIKAESMPTLLKTIADKNSFLFSSTDFARNEIPVKLVYARDGDQLKLAWSLSIDQVDNEDYYNVFVDANSGAVISKNNFTVKCTIHKNSFAKHVGCNKDIALKETIANFAEASAIAKVGSGTYNVFALPTESPIHGNRSILVDPFFPDSSPHGWHDTNNMEGAEWTITRGNNVHAYLDKENTGFSENDEPEGGDDLIFDYAYDIANQADSNEVGATVNLFYMVNMMHDITKRLGFDEAAGNFQSNNYGNGGNGGDYVLAQASDGFLLETPTLNNANFATPPDGGSGQMQMFLWENPSGILSIDEPIELAGFLGDVLTATGTTGFGGPIPLASEAAITGKAVVAYDAIPGEGTTCCGDIVNIDEVAGKIALIDRGLCDFSLKAFHAQEAGAISVIICNVEGASALGGMSGGQNASDVFITPLLIQKEDCDRIRASINAGIEVTLSIQSRPPMGPDYLDGAVDNGIIAHEYGHGISNRLIGGPSQTGCLTSDEQAGEGISDYFSLVTTVEEGDAGEDSRGIGNYADGQNVNGVGIRRFPYSTDLKINPLVYDDVKGTTSQYDLGEVWTSALWEVYWGFVNKFGLDTSWEDENSGNYKAVRLTIEGMKFGPCNPSLIKARDAILAMDTLLYGGENAEILWTAFAKRGFGYLATDGGSSDDRNDGIQSFEPFPLAIQTLKVQETVQDIVDPGENVVVTITAQNHIPETQTGVLITTTIPEGLTYVDGSSSMGGTMANGVLSIEVGEMAFQDEITITYTATASNTNRSQTLFYDDVDNADFGAYDFNATEGFNLWSQTASLANSGEFSWAAEQLETEVETDFFMIIPALQVVGDSPALKFLHRYDTEIGFDGGFLQVSKDGGQVFEHVKGKFIRNGYPIGIAYGTFAIPSLEGFSGSTNEEWVDSYLDLSDYIGEEIRVKFRFGTDEMGGVAAPFPGWYVDDLEMVDLKSYETYACISSENSSEEQCTTPKRIIVASDGLVGTDNLEAEGFTIKVAPNPASDFITIGLTAERSTPVQLLLSTLEGRVVRNTTLVADGNEAIRTFDTSDLGAGMYLVQVKSEKGITTKKVVIQ